MADPPVPPKPLIALAFWAKKSAKSGSGKYHFWDTADKSLCGGGPDKPTINRRLKQPYLSCQRCLSVLAERKVPDGP